MFLLRRPSEEFIHQTLTAQREQQWTYAQVGWTKDSRCPTGYIKNESRAVIGRGEEAFGRAKDAIDCLQMLNLGWLQTVSAPRAIRPGELVGTLVQTLGVYALNVAKIVYVEESTSRHRYGFGYGTLPEYPVSGEERFTVSYDPATDEVVYEVFSFSQPSTWFTKLGWPVVRQAQKRFMRDTIAKMKSVCEG